MSSGSMEGEPVPVPGAADVTISKFEGPLKTLPVVYIQTPFSGVNNVQPLQFAANPIPMVSKLLLKPSEASTFKPKLSFVPVPVKMQTDDLKLDTVPCDLSVSNKGPNILKGISILKKNHAHSSDGPLCEQAPQEPVIVPDISTLKTERRRKSNFSYRKDYDDLEITAVSKDDLALVIDEDRMEECSDKLDINMNDDCDMETLLKWDDGIGSLPNSDVKFIKNEFGMVEYVTDEEYRKILDSKLCKKEEPARCMECGCFGLLTEFLDTKYCSNNCQDTAQSVGKIRRKRKRGFTKRLEQIKPEKDSDEDEESTSNNSQDKFPTYPWACTKKGFSWSKYLDHMKAKAAPVKLFKDAFPYTRNGFRAGMKLEGVDPQHPSYFCVLSVAEAIGYRIRLHFDGYPDNYDFWVNADTMDIFPIGWCEKHGHVLQPPPGYTVDNFNWIQYLKVTKTTAAPKHLFANRAGNAICPNGFRVGMKLEAVDRKNTALVCVATVRDMMDNRILVHFDSWDDIYDYWADPTSPYIHPVGWCDRYSHNLTPPSDHPHPESFTWEKYLKETKSQAAPVRAFKQRPACGFKRGMRLECVDKRVPQLIRVATVNDVKDHQIRIHFDGWPDRYSYWVDDDSIDIHPIGWCQKTGHPIEPPLTPDDVYDFLECPTVGCRGQGDIRGPKFPTHSTQKYCPYAEDNIDAERVLNDRLLSPDRTLEAVVPVSREPRDKPKPRGRPPKQPKPEPTEAPPPKPKRKYKKRKIEPTIEEKAIALIEQSKVAPAEQQVFHKHSKFLQKYANVDSDPRQWTKMEVADFVSTIPHCHDEWHVFVEEEMDGEAFLALNQTDILDILSIKVGPAVKLYNSILLLRQHINNQLFE